jgi:hypothetical protein
MLKEILNNNKPLGQKEDDNELKIMNYGYNIYTFILNRTT